MDSNSIIKLSNQIDFLENLRNTILNQIPHKIEDKNQNMNFDLQVFFFEIDFLGGDQFFCRSFYTDKTNFRKGRIGQIRYFLLDEMANRISDASINFKALCPFFRNRTEHAEWLEYLTKEKEELEQEREHFSTLSDQQRKQLFYQWDRENDDSVEYDPATGYVYENGRVSDYQPDGFSF